MRILIVEDDQSLAGAQRRLLQAEGFKADVISTGEAAIGAINGGCYELVVLDLRLPGYDGFEVIRRVRNLKNKIPILVVTARSHMEDKIRGLNLGADDYIVKPFDTAELVARAKALVRRAEGQTTGQFINGPLVMDIRTRRVFLNGEVLEVTPREWMVLELLQSNVGKLIPKERIGKSIRKTSEEEISMNAIEVYVSRLRTKLEPQGIVIRTVRGFGYMMELYRGSGQTGRNRNL